MTVNREHDDEYRAVMQALADREAMPPDAAARVERDLQRAFAAYRAAPTAPAIGPAEAGRWRWWIAAAAAAAALVVVASGAVRWRAAHLITEDHVTQAAGGAGRTDAATTPAADRPAIVAPPAPREPVASVSQPPRPARAAATVLRPAGFVPLPEAAGLPPFESGTIVRLEVPVASLPGYGVDISPASDAAAVEADVLVGQDGQARAIRLVTNSARSTQ